MLRALALAAAAASLVNDTSAAPRRDRTESGACSIHKTPAAQPERKYFILFTRPHSGADLLCKLLNRHPEITCAGEPFNPSTQPTPHQTADRLGWSVAEQRADVAGFVRAHFAKCHTRVCGFRLMPNHLPRDRLVRLFLPGCGVQKLILERNNVTEEFLAQRKHSAERDATGSFEKFEAAHREWYARLRKMMPRARTYKLSHEDLSPPAPAKVGAGTASAAGNAAAAAAAAASKEAVLFDLYNFLDVSADNRHCLLDHCASPALAGARSYREFAAQGSLMQLKGLAAHAANSPADGDEQAAAKAKAAAAAARARAHPSSGTGRSSHRGKTAEHRARVEWVGGLAFASVTIAGCCLAIGVAIGQSRWGGGGGGAGAGHAGRSSEHEQERLALKDEASPDPRQPRHHASS